MNVVGEVAMRHADAFGRAGRARCVDHVREVVLRDRDVRRGGRLVVEALPVAVDTDDLALELR